MKVMTLKNWRLLKTRIRGSHKYHIKGESYGSNRFEDGTIIFTSIIKSINFEKSYAITLDAKYYLM